MSDREHAHALIDRLPGTQLSALIGLLETMLPDQVSSTLSSSPIEDEEISEEEARAAERSREWFKHNQGTSFEDVVTEMGFTMDQLRDYKEPA